MLIALFGGFAGILEQARKEKGTVMSGVAIATALMPPLCTAGFGLAKWNLHFFFGAMYLFTINAIFIMFATYLACKYLHFHQKSFADERTARRTRTVITAVVLLVTVPSIWSAFIMIRNNNFTTSAYTDILSDVASTSGSCSLVVNIYKLGNTKQIGLGGIIITGDMKQDAASGIEEQKVITFDDAATYTLQGVRVDKPTKGIYIQNGKKIIIK